MSTSELEFMRQEAKNEEKEEIEKIRKKYKERQNQQQKNHQSNQEKQNLIQQAQKQEQQEKEQLKQKYKQRQQKNQTKNQNTNNTQQNLIQQAQKQEQQEKEQLRQKFRQKIEKTTAEGSEEEDIYKRALAREEPEDTDIWELYLIKKPEEDAESDNHLTEIQDANLEVDDLESEEFSSEDFKTEEFKGEIKELKTVQTVETVDKTVKIDETIDRSALLAKYNIHDFQEDDVDHILENFDKPIIDESIDKIEERIVLNIKNSALSHPKIQWVNVLVFLDEDEFEGNIKIFAEYVERGFLNRMRSEDNERLEVELMQIALYEVWDIFTTLGVNTDDLETKIEVEVELDRA